MLLGALGWVLVGLGFTGCGGTGSVAPVSVKPGAAVAGAATPLRVGRVRVAPTAAVNHTVAACNWGRFGENDCTAIEESLRRSLAEACANAAPGAPGVRVAVARYMLDFSNTRASVLVIVDWTTEAGGVLGDTERL